MPNVAMEAVVTTVVMRQQETVSRGQAIPIVSIEFQPKSFALVRFFQRKCATIPADAGRRKTWTDRLVTMIMIGASDRWLLHRFFCRMNFQAGNQIFDFSLRSGILGQ